MNLVLSRPQWGVFNDPSRFKVIVAGRRFGKTFLACVWLLMLAVNKPGRYWYVAPTYTQAKMIVWALLNKLIPERYIDSTNSTALSIYLINGSEISLKGADRPDSLRGPGLSGLVMDEFAFTHKEAWFEVLRPALSDHQGPALFITTPAGYNWAYDLYMLGKAGKKGWKSWTFKTIDGGRVPAEEIEEARETMDPRIFRQEYEASFETLSGRVYSNFDRELHIRNDVYDLGAELLVGMDFNVNPMSAVFASRAGNECHIFKALEIMTSNTDEMAREIVDKFPARKVIVYPDPSGNARKTNAKVGQTDFSILKGYGFKVVAPAAAPLVVDRVNNTNALMMTAAKTTHIYVHAENCAPLIRSWDGLIFKPGTSLPDKGLGLDHMADAADYLTWSAFNMLTKRRGGTRKFKRGR